MMGKQSKPNIKIRNLLESSSLFYQDLLGYSPKQTSLQQIPENNWLEFTDQRGLNPNSSGIYLPRNQAAIIRDENPLSLFHEYFGHGLYCEQNQSGQKLVTLEKKLQEEESQEFNQKQFTLDDLQKFRNKNKTFQDLQEFRNQNLIQYELFAIWTEYLLSKEHEISEHFEKKYNSLSREDRELVDSVIDFSKSHGNLATFYGQGIAKKITPKKVKKLISEMCKKNLESIKFGILFGSKKPFSDIDIYLVSDKIEPFSSDWIDTRVHTQAKFEEGLRNFDIRMTDPLFSGEFIMGDKQYYEQAKKQAQNQQISINSIKYNLKKSRDYERLRKKDLKLSDQVADPKDYTRTYLANALALKQGLKPFIKENLENFIEDNSLILKGGTVNNAT